jgi:PAS domain S-box-containing protein
VNPFRNLGLLSKITLVVMIILLAFFALFSILNYRRQRAITLGEAVEKARIVAFEAIRTREYLSQQLLAGNVQLSLERYGLIPIVASQRIGLRVGEDVEYRIHQVSSRYRNVKNAPDAFEAQALERFNQDPGLQEIYAITDMNGEQVFRYLHPFLADQSCLQCHGDPAEAPDFIKRLFPPETDQAYHYQLGQIIGAASVTIPMAKLSRQIHANLRNALFYLGGIFLALMTCLGILMRVAVTAPLGRLGRVIDDILRTGRFESKIPRRGRDEIGRLIDGFNEMMVNLQQKTSDLEESESRFRVLTETARDVIVSFLANGQIILFNREAERTFGYSKTEILGVSVARLIAESCTDLHAEGVENYLAGHAEELLRKVQIVPCRRRDGGRFDLELSLSMAESEGHRFYTAILRKRD